MDTFPLSCETFIDFPTSSDWLPSMAIIPIATSAFFTASFALLSLVFFSRRDALQFSVCREGTNGSRSRGTPLSHEEELVLQWVASKVHSLRVERENQQNQLHPVEENYIFLQALCSLAKTIATEYVLDHHACWKSHENTVFVNTTHMTELEILIDCMHCFNCELSRILKLVLITFNWARSTSAPNALEADSFSRLFLICRTEEKK